MNPSMENHISKKIMIFVLAVIASSVVYLFMVFKTNAIYDIDTSALVNDTYVSWTPAFAVSIARNPEIVQRVIEEGVYINNTGAGEGEGEGITVPVPSGAGTIEVPAEVVGTETISVPPSIAEFISWLSGLGYNNAAVAGILGNMRQEMGKDFNPAACQGHKNGTITDKCRDPSISGDGHGIVQWDGGRRVNLINHAESMGLNWWDFAAQKSYFELEINGSEKSGGGVDVLNSFGDSEDAARRAAFQFAKKFERCAGTYKIGTYEEHETNPTIDGWTTRRDEATAYYTFISTSAR